MKSILTLLFLPVIAIILFSCENSDDSNDYTVTYIRKITPRFGVENVDALFTSSNSITKSTSATPNIYTYDADGLINMLQVVDENGDTIINGFKVGSLTESYDLNRYYAYFEGAFSVVVGFDVNTNENVDSIFYRMLIRKSDGRMFEMPYDICVDRSTLYSLNASFEYDRNGNLYFSDVDGDVYKFSVNNTETPEFKYLFNQYIGGDPHNDGIFENEPKAYIVVDEDYLILKQYSQFWVYKDGVLTTYDYWEQLNQGDYISVLWSNNNGKLYAYVMPNWASRKISEISFIEDSIILTDVKNSNALNGISLLSTFTMKNQNGDCYFINQNDYGFWYFNNTDTTFKQVSLPVTFVESFTGNDENVFAVKQGTKLVFYNSDIDEVKTKDFSENIIEVVVSTPEQTTLKSINSGECNITVTTSNKIYTVDATTGEITEETEMNGVSDLIGM